MSDNKANALRLLADAKQLYQKKLYDKALKLFSEAAELDPLLFEAHFSVAKTNIRLNQPDKSVELLEEAIALAPDNKKNYYTLGFASILFDAKHYKQAYEVVELLFDRKIKADKLPDLVKYPLYAKAYSTIEKVLEKYSLEDLDRIDSKVNILIKDKNTKEEWKKIKLKQLNDLKKNFSKKIESNQKRIDLLNQAEKTREHKTIDLFNNFKDFVNQISQFSKIVDLDQKWEQVEKSINTIFENRKKATQKSSIQKLKTQNSQIFKDYNKSYNMLQLFNKIALYPYFDNSIVTYLKKSQASYNQLNKAWQNADESELKETISKLPQIIEENKSKSNLIENELSSKIQLLHSENRINEQKQILPTLLALDPSNPIYQDYQENLGKKRKKKIVYWVLGAILVLFLIPSIYYGISFFNEKQAWSKAVEINTADSYQKYVEEYINGKYVKNATKFIEKEAYTIAVSENTSVSLKEFLDTYSNSEYVIAVPLQVSNKEATIKIRGYETLTDSFLIETPANVDSIHLVKGSKVEVLCFTNSVQEKPLLLVVDENSTIQFIDIKNNNGSKTKANGIEAIPFNFVQTQPVYPGCNQRTQASKKKCFKKKVQQFIKENVDKESLKAHLGTGNKKIPYYFIVDEAGNITNIQVRTDSIAANQITKTIQMLPVMQSAMQDNKPTSVSFTDELSLYLGKNDRNQEKLVDVVEVKPVTIPSNLTIQMADRAPIFPNCEGKSGVPLVKCTSNKINSFISENIDHNNLKGKKLPAGKLVSIITFKITSQGRVSNVQVQNSHQILKDEVTRVVNNIPYMSPALYENIQVAINYKLTLTTTISLDE